MVSNIPHYKVRNYFTIKQLTTSVVLKKQSRHPTLPVSLKAKGRSMNTIGIKKRFQKNRLCKILITFV